MTASIQLVCNDGISIAARLSKSSLAVGDQPGSVEILFFYKMSLVEYGSDLFNFWTAFAIFSIPVDSYGIRIN